jgi:hypothetical protein
MSESPSPRRELVLKKTITACVSCACIERGLERGMAKRIGRLPIVMINGLAGETELELIE